MNKDNRCNCRFTLCDMGYFECSLEKGHEGNHSFNDEEKGYNIEWKPRGKKDIIITEKWLIDNTNFLTSIEELLPLIENAKSITYKEIFKDSIYGEDTTFGLIVVISDEYKEFINKEFMNKDNKQVDWDKVFEEEEKKYKTSFDWYIQKKFLKLLNINPTDYLLHFNVQILYEDDETIEEG